jgi:hypothetical protein
MKKGILGRIFTKKKTKTEGITETPGENGILNKVLTNNKTKKMKNVKGILTPEIEAKIASWLDDQIKLNGILETVDGLAFKLVISQLDNNLGEKIPEPYKTEIREIVLLVLEDKDYENAITRAFDFINEKIDIPDLDDETEDLLFKGLISIVLSIVAKINTKKV